MPSGCANPYTTAPLCSFLALLSGVVLFLLHAIIFGRQHLEQTEHLKKKKSVMYWPILSCLVWLIFRSLCRLDTYKTTCCESLGDVTQNEFQACLLSCITQNVNTGENYTTQCCINLLGVLKSEQFQMHNEFQ